MAKATVHTMLDGFCTVCGETSEWLAGTKAITVPADAPKGHALSIEMGGDGPAYGKIHKAGCKDLRDGMPIGAATTKAVAAELAEEATCWDREASEWTYAPCVTVR